MKLIYIASPYTAKDAAGVVVHVRAAAEVGQECLRRGWAVICPHSMTWDWDIGTGLDAEVFYRTDLELLRRCDAIVLVGEWLDSKGARAEFHAAKRDGKDIYLGIDEVPVLVGESAQ